MEFGTYEGVKPLKGYANAAEPTLIHGSGFKEHDAPMGYGNREGIATQRENQMASFVEDVDRKVKRLPHFQRDIIQNQYMQPERPGYASRLPSDTETHQYLRTQQWYVSERYYDEEKAKAIMTLAEVFRIAVFVTNDET